MGFLREEGVEPGVDCHDPLEVRRGGLKVPGRDEDKARVELGVGVVEATCNDGLDGVERLRVAAVAVERPGVGVISENILAPGEIGLCEPQCVSRLDVVI